jgi:hypothetical protein
MLQTTNPGSPTPTLQLFSLSGQVRVNLEAGIDRRPNAPVTAGFVTGGLAVAYPITYITGTSAFASLGSVSSANVTDIVQPAYIYMDVNDGSDSATGFDRDPDFAFFMDTDGMTLVTSNATFPRLHIALDTIGNTMQYAETTLKARGFRNGPFLVSGCSTNTFTITRTLAPPSSTGPAQPSNPGAVGDPSFSGFRGQRYQIHGVADTVYSIITDDNMALNAEFVFLTSGQCAFVDGKVMTNCWSHPGSYFGSLGLRTINGDELIIRSGPAKKGFSLIQLNNQTLIEAQTVTGMSGSNEPLTLVIKNPHQMTLNTGLFEFEFENSDMFINIVSVRIADWRALTHKVKSHGLLGQTWELRKGVIEGTVDDYAEANNELLGYQFLYNKFQPKSQ